MKTFAQLFDAPAEIVIAHGRVVLAAFSLAAIMIDPTQPLHLAPLVAGTLMIYAACAVVLLAGLHRRLIHNLNVATGACFRPLGCRAAPGFDRRILQPVSGVFHLCAARRFAALGLGGIAGTMVVLVLIAGMIAALDSTGGQMPNVHQTVIRGAYLIATGTILTYASAHREHERNRLAKLAHAPAAVSSGNVSGRIGGNAQAGRRRDGGIQCPCRVGGRQSQIQSRHLAKREMRNHRSDRGLSAVVVAPEMEGQTFSRTLPDLDRLNLANGSVRSMPDVLRGELVSKLQIADFSSSPFRGLAASGRLFILGNIRPSDDHLPITQIIADRVGTELDRQIFLERATRDAAMRERAVIMRDLHDSLLQSLTAARTHLEFLPADGEKANAQLQTVRELLRMEQRRVREFVDATYATDNESVAIEMLRPLVEDTAGCGGARCR